jgi:hypothetical protein
MKRLSCGLGRKEISPPTSCLLLGYDQRAEIFPEGGHDGVLDPLWATIVLWEGGEERLAWVHLDLAILEDRALRFYRELLAPVLAVDGEKIFFCCTHTHSGPFPWRAEWGDDPLEPVPEPLRAEPSARYADQLGEALVACAHAAVEDLCEVEALEVRHGILGLGYIRRVEVPAASGETEVGMAWNLREWTGPDPRPTEDPAVVFFSVKRPARPDWHGWNAAAHPVVLGKHSNVVSADWPGAVRREWQTRWPGEDLLFFHGAGGDVHPWLATGWDPEDLNRVAAPAFSYLSLLRETPVAPTPDPKAWHFARRESVLRGKRIELAACRVGPIRLLAIPGELFSTTGQSLRKAAGAPFVLATTSNGWSGYWPTREAMARGGYEVNVSPGREPGDAEWLAGEALSLLEEIA